MGVYLNPGKGRFQMALNSQIYVDKTAMILYLNTLVNTNQRYVSVSRPRRFGKTMAADMLCAYYGRGADSRAAFAEREIARPEQKNGAALDQYLGKFDVLRLVMTDFFRGRCVGERCIAENDFTHTAGSGKSLSVRFAG